MGVAKHSIFVLSIRFVGRERVAEFHFDKPPSRQDFLAMCQNHEPWTFVWDNTILPIIRDGRCDWPMVDSMRKAAHSRVQDSDGRELAEISVYRNNIYSATGYDRVAIDILEEDRQATLKRVPNDGRRDEASHYLRMAENRIRERLSELNCPSGDDARKIMAEILIEGGYVTGKSRGRRTTKATAMV